jgi:CheY-like chemotaxis protein
LPHHRFRIAHPLPNTYGMLLLSRLELVDPEVRFLLKPDIPSIRTGVRLRSDEVIMLYGVHPEPPSPTEADTSLPRDAELVLAGREITQSHRPTIVAGDLNDVAWSHTSRLFRRISRLLDHPVQVRSQVGKGSVFSVLVPVDQTAGRPRAPQRPRAPRHTTIDGVRVLVIDNEIQVLEGMTSLLDTWHCHVIAASDAEAALSELDRTGEKPELLLVDYHLDHGRVGTDAINAIRDRVGAGVPAAIITADHNPAIREDVRKSAGVSLLLKPIKPARLRALIASVRE